MRHIIGGPSSLVVRRQVDETVRAEGARDMSGASAPECAACVWTCSTGCVILSRKGRPESSSST